MNRLTLVSALCALLPFTSADTARATKIVVDRIVAIVNDEIILQSELDQMALPTFREQVDPQSAEGRRKLDSHRRKVLDSLIEKQLIALQAKEMKIHTSEEEVRRAMDEVKKNNNLDDAQFQEALRSQGFTLPGYKKQLKQQLVELKVINQAVRSRVTIADDEVRAYYAQNVRQLAGDDEQVHLRQILIGAPKDASQDGLEVLRRRAISLVEEVRAGKEFEEVAKEQGEASGGDIGWVSRGDLPEALREVVGAMDKGDVRGPLLSERGFHIIKLIDKKQSSVRPFDEVKEQLRRQLYDQQVEKAIQAYTKELRRKAHVDIRL